MGDKPIPAFDDAGSLTLLIRTNVLQVWRRMKAARHQSKLLTSFIGLFVFGYLVVSFALFRKGLQFASTFPGLGALLIERLLFVLFAFLFGLLLLSNLVVSYTSFFRNRETSYLMSLPVRPETIYQWKLLESAVVASWAFLFLIAPLLAAYGLTRSAPWHFYLVTLFLIGLFIVLPAVIGAWMAVGIARWMDRKLFQIVALLAMAALLWGGGFWIRPESITNEMLETRVIAVLDKLLERTSFAEFPLLPSYWLSAGVLHWSEGSLRASFFFILVLTSHALLFGFLACTGTGKFFHEASSATQSRGSVFGRWGWFREMQAKRGAFEFSVGPIERFFRGIRWVPVEVRAVLVKDARVFWRDTAQWGQTVMLFGLLGVYIMNLRHFTQHLTHPFWLQVVSFLNLGACSLNLATLTTRFVFPQFSLEGKRIWIIGMAPLGMLRVLRAKYWLTVSASLLLTLSLILLSCHMLRLGLDRTLYFCFAITVMTLTLNAMALGFGTLYPNFREDNPSKIVSGFGGTLCLVLSFLYIVGSVALLAMGSPWSRWVIREPAYAAAGWIGFALISMLLGLVPLRLGLKRASQMEIS